MATWRYIKGSEKDFKKFSDEVVAVFRHKEFGTHHGCNTAEFYINNSDFELVAQRERVTSINDDRLAQDMGVTTLITERGSEVYCLLHDCAFGEWKIVE